MEKEPLEYKEHVKDLQQYQDSSIIEAFSEPDSIQMPLVKSPEELKFLKKLNWTVLPIVFFIIFIQVSTILCMYKCVILTNLFSQFS
jgi:hypothetical protein